MQTVCILGRQPKLGLVELESLYGASVITPIGTQAALLDITPNEVDFDRLGGSTRSCEVLKIVETRDWPALTGHLLTILDSLVAYLPEGKVRLGITHIGHGVSPKTLNATGLTLKRSVKAMGRSIRVVPNTTHELNTAQVLHNQLTGLTGIELVIIPDKSRTIIARTVHSQDINAYAARDQKRPKRDARVGMLPPKLAQLIINLVVGTTEPLSKAVVLDPFCGTGVVLQEALLMGYGVQGTDLEPRMIEYSQVNLDWLANDTNFVLQSPKFALEQGDATNHSWNPLPNFIACETYLGRPLSGMPRPEILSDIMSDVDTIHRKFLLNVAKQVRPGFRMCLAVPAWRVSTHRSDLLTGRASSPASPSGAENRFSFAVLSHSTSSTAPSVPRRENNFSTQLRGTRTNDGFLHLKTLGNLEELGYNRVRFVHVRNQDLIYHRPEQLVARELVILERK